MSSDLFDFAQNSSEGSRAPLAHRMRPRTLDEFYGQERILAPGKPLRQWIETDRVPSLILWGPPGCGKTTLAQLIADRTRAGFVSLSAVLSGVKDIKEAVEKAKLNRKMRGQKTLLFVDEIHRFNKSQQDALLPHVEDGTVTLIGATTENPSFELNSALLSRVRVFRFERLTLPALVRVIQSALVQPERGLGGMLALSVEAVQWLALSSEGDARRALTALENAALSAGGSSQELGVEELKAALDSALERQPIPYDKSGEEHYNVVSAFIKCMRASDPDASVYYLARMIEGGEDPLFIARRMVIFAAEDVGNADPRALQMTLAAQQAVDFVGMPESRIVLSQVALYLALAPKSRAAYDAIGRAIDEVRKTGALPVPLSLRNAVTPLMKREGYGQGSKDARLPAEISNAKFYLNYPAKS